ncbi:MAG: hypothetical protein CSA82_02865, partial [Actinobacteria bacterium]
YVFDLYLPNHQFRHVSILLLMRALKMVPQLKNMKHLRHSRRNFQAARQIKWITMRSPALRNYLKKHRKNQRNDRNAVQFPPGMKLFLAHARNRGVLG